MKTAAVLFLSLVTSLFAGSETASATRPVAFSGPVNLTGNYVNFSDVDQMPKPSLQPAPRYPLKWSLAEVNGSARVSFVINESGVPTQVQCSAATDKDFADAAVESVRKWRYTPAKKDGKKVACAAEQQIDFNLVGASGPTASRAD